MGWEPSYQARESRRGPCSCTFCRQRIVMVHCQIQIWVSGEGFHSNCWILFWTGPHFISSHDIALGIKSSLRSSFRWSIYHVKQRSCINVSKMKLPSIGMWPMLILSWIQGHPYLVVKVAEIQRDKKKKKQREKRKAYLLLFSYETFFSWPSKKKHCHLIAESTILSHWELLFWHHNAVFSIKFLVILFGSD